MVIYKRIVMKNFLSVGDQPMELKLNENKSTLITGKNGCGKSAVLLDAICFVQFNKAFRDVTKPQLINSINNKNCLVELEFSIGNIDYKIVRGMKPTVFEIYQNGVMVNQDANTRDYQAFLEQNILKFNHKTFTQVAVIGSASYTPFMQLPAGQRRDIIEELLDIKIFSRMNQLLKEKISKIKSNINDVVNQLGVYKEKIELQQKFIREVEAINDDNIKLKNEEIDNINSEIAIHTKSNEDLDNEIEKLKSTNGDSVKLTKKYNKLLELKQQINLVLNKTIDDKSFYEKNQNCPTCQQKIPASMRDEHEKKCTSKIAELDIGIKKLNSEIDDITSQIDITNKNNQRIRDLQSQITVNNNSIKMYNNQIKKLQSDIKKLQQNSGDTKTARLTLEQYQSEKETLQEHKLELSDQHAYSLIAHELLKDTGIKTKIVKQYLPVINKLVNQYLQTLDFFVSFHLDETFTESIKSRHRDDFTYSSFSEGEKQRINLALLFTWRKIASMKNSINTNLLILDETFDSSLDNDGVENLAKILDSVNDNNNVFVISHKGEVIEDLFTNRIEFYKDKNFTRMKQYATA